MSRIGKRPIPIPENIEVVVEANSVRVSGPKGELSVALSAGVKAKVEDGKIFLERKSNSKQVRQLHGTISRHLTNVIKGVSEGWSKTLELVGTGYRARLEGTTLVLSVGFSHPVRIDPPEGITFSVEENKVTVSGIDKTLVGQAAANIRTIRPPEPYKGKGIKYEDEVIRRKAGKVAKAGPAVG